jgi:hypothetical protein
MIMITSVRPDDERRGEEQTKDKRMEGQMKERKVDEQMRDIHKAYIELVKRSYMYQHGDIIKNPLFDEAVKDILEMRGR